MQLLIQSCLDPSHATEIFSLPNRRIFSLPKIVRNRNKSGLQYSIEMLCRCTSHVTFIVCRWVDFYAADENRTGIVFAIFQTRRTSQVFGPCLYRLLRASLILGWWQSCKSACRERMFSCRVDRILIGRPFLLSFSFYFSIWSTLTPIS